MTVERFRAISELTIDFGPNTALLGENNAGKSSILAALNLFFDSAPKVRLQDFHADDCSEPIIVTIEFSELTPDELTQFSGNLIDGHLKVSRKFDHLDKKENGKFFVQADVNPSFSECRGITTAQKKRDAYKILQSKYSELSNVTNADEIDGALEEWESKNPDKLERTMVAGFRGFKNVAVGQLKDRTDLVYVPAVKDTAEELNDEKKSPVLNLLNTIAKQTIESSEEFKSFRDQANEQLAMLTSPENVPQLKAISGSLTDILGRYYEGSELIASWAPVTELPISYPKSDLRVKDFGYDAPLENVGHGLQRAILFSVLEYLAKDRSSASTDNAEGSETKFRQAQSDIILLVEEPEIFQHPIKQRLFRAAFKTLTEGFSSSTGIRMQVVYTTHSPLMVDIRDFDEICVLRREGDGAFPRVTVRQASIEECAQRVAEALGAESDIKLYRRGLHIFTPQIAEGFFAKKVVLVEGVGDQAVLQGYYKQMDRDHLAEGIYIVEAGGKTKFDKPIAIFNQLQIPVFCVFDNDRPKDQDANYNKLLQKLCDEENEVDWPHGCHRKFAAFEGKLETYILSEAGENQFSTIRDRLAAIHSIKSEDVLKSPAVASEMFTILIKSGVEFSLLKDIVDSVDSMSI